MQFLTSFLFKVLGVKRDFLERCLPHGWLPQRGIFFPFDACLGTRAMAGGQGISTPKFFFRFFFSK
uniref:hypothetical protein n=1 Tax=Paenibacillus sp. TaxID=58172 RepID=UPI00191FF9EA|nr:hypothetical protein [Paenibacillus sp.]